MRKLNITTDREGTIFNKIILLITLCQKCESQKQRSTMF